ncbi:hypothetical protein M407DRAFT_231163 [Tulasnella calospora MUT 4182]|uniref:MACPF domain-containing protein n=1 Tax=Tulasnella calospora MUT 4182 TaxID=1051891 RepID=A0A0C3QC23_9AGAM|nr:hypothetical protein M407DRAFT_231163 [Tulasnella calospora MUT 4182]
MADELDNSTKELLAGWVDAKLAAKTPYVDAEISASVSKSNEESESQSFVYVIGRHYFSYRKISLKGYVSELKPHPEFKQAVMDALAIENDVERSKEVTKVLKWYGTMFPTSVELGGKKHSTIRKQNSDKSSEEDLKKEMGVKLGRSFGPVGVEAEVSGGTQNKQTHKQSSGSESESFLTVGGNIAESDMDKWKQSLAEPRKWAVTRVLEVESILTLFDKETRLKIALAALKTPVYQFRNKSGRHCLSTNPDESKIPVTSDGPWTNYGTVGMALKEPLDGAVPLYHLYNGQRHLFTTNEYEKRQHLSEWGFTNQGTICYVHSAQKAGTILLNRMWNNGFPDNIYVPPSEIDGQTKWGYVKEDVRYYLYSS